MSILTETRKTQVAADIPTPDKKAQQQMRLGIATLVGPWIPEVIGMTYSFTNEQAMTGIFIVLATALTSTLGALLINTAGKK